MRVAPRTRPAEKIAPGDDARAIVRPAATPGERVRQDREAGRLRKAGERGGQGRVGLGPGHDQPAASSGEAPGEARDLGRSQRPRPGQHVGERARRLVVRRLTGSEVTIRDERLAEREVEVDGAGGTGQRRGDGTSRHGADMPARLRGPVEERKLRAPFRVGAEQAHLVDGLRGAAVAELGGSIGREEHQRDPAERRLDRGGQEVGGRRAGRDQDARRPPGGPRQAQREEPGRPLVEQDPHPEPGMGPQRERKRRRARSRAHHHVAHAGPDQLVDKRPQGDGVRHAAGSGSRPRAEATGRSFILDSSHSRAGSESATIPQPA